MKEKCNMKQKNDLLKVFQWWTVVLLVLAKDQTAEEDKDQVFFDRGFNRRSHDANTAVNSNEDHLTEFVFHKYDERSSQVIEVAVWWKRKVN